MEILYVVLAGCVLPLAGCSMQKMWKNQLGDVYSLGLGSAVCLGAILGLRTGISKETGALLFCTICSMICHQVSNRVSISKIIVFGMISGAFIGSMSSIFCNNVEPIMLAEYYKWTSTMLPSYVDPLLFGVTMTILVLSLVGVIKNFGNKKSLFFVLMMVTSVIVITGPIWTLSLLAPNATRLFLHKQKVFTYKLWVQSSMLLGVIIMLLTHLVTLLQPFGLYMPISSTMSILCIPLILLTLPNSK